MATKKHPGGRPTKFDAEVAQAIETAIRAGAYPDTAAASAGISRSTFYDWMRRGGREKADIRKGLRKKPRKREAQFVQFSDDILRAMAEVELAMNAAVVGAGQRDWKAAAWWLEHTKNRYRRKQEISHTGSGGGAIKADIKAKVKNKTGLTKKTVAAIRRDVLKIPDPPAK